MKRLYILTCFSVVLALGVFFLKDRPQTTIAVGKGLVVPKDWLIVNKTPGTPVKDVRPADQTFLTFPEWFLVFSPEEQADYFKHSTATSFPFVSHTAQIWQSYKIVNDQIKDNFPVNTGYHFMIWVIGTSASVEYLIKSGYEMIIGRITDTGVPETDEDKFNVKFTQDYVDFIKDRPWYEFDFGSQLTRLTTTSFIDDHFLRKLDRKYFLFTELLVKYFYGKLIGLGTAQVYETALPTTAVILENDSLQYLPRYNKFANAAIEIAKKGGSFKEIAGNNSAILLTILVSSEYPENFEKAQTIFIQPVASDKSIKRIALTVEVASLSELLRYFEKNQIKVEHVFDY